MAIAVILMAARTLTMFRYVAAAIISSAFSHTRFASIVSSRIATAMEFAI